MAPLVKKRSRPKAEGTITDAKEKLYICNVKKNTKQKKHFRLVPQLLWQPNF